MSHPTDIHPVVSKVTERIRHRSRDSRASYLRKIEGLRKAGPHRHLVSCSNLAHSLAACSAGEKRDLSDGQKPNIAIVSAYNDMLSAHQPFEDYPGVIKAAVKDAGGIAQFAGGTPAMCDGITQGQSGMELSLFSRDVIALSTAIALSHNVFDGVLCPGGVRQDRAGFAYRCIELRTPARDIRAGRPHAVRLAQPGEGRSQGTLCCR